MCAPAPCSHRPRPFALPPPHAPPALLVARLARVTRLWKDSVKASDGLECSTNDPTHGYMSEDCLRYIDALVTQVRSTQRWTLNCGHYQTPPRLSCDP
jgi:hypothetical protein